MNNQLIPLDNKTVLDVMTDQASMQNLLDRVELEVMDFVPDTSTVEGRKEIASQSRIASSSKVFIDKALKSETDEWARKKKAVDGCRKLARDFCDNLRDKARAPLTEYEEEEHRLIQVAAAKAEMEADEIEAHERNDLYEREAKVLAAEAKIEAERLERERVILSDKAEADRKALETQIRLDAKDKAEREAAEALEQERKKLAEAEQRGKEQAERADREKQEATDRAEQDRLDAVENERIRVAQVAARKQAEQDRLDEIERVKSENVKHQESVNNTILAALVKGGVDEKAAKVVVTLVAQNKIPAMSIRY